MHQFGMVRTGKRNDAAPRRARYQPPVDVQSIPLARLLDRCGRGALDSAQMEMLRERGSDIGRDVTVFYAGDIHLLDGPAVSIVGTRDVSDEGRRRALKLARGLTNNGVTVVSGLAKGVDTAAHMGALESGATVAVIGTPLSKAYPAENAHLQEEIYTRHLLLSPFAEGATVFKGNFPARNRVMAAVTDATVIIEASDTSGTLHQAAECQRLGRTLFILQSVLDDPSLSWPSRFIGKPNVEVLRTVDDVLKRVSA